MPKNTHTAALMWKRILAFIIDILIIDLTIAWPFKSIIRDKLPSDISLLHDYIISDPKTANLIITMSIIIGILTLLYFIVMEYKLNQSIGKMIFNIYIIDEKREIELWQCVVRSLFIVPVFPLVLFWIIDPIYMFFNVKNQRLLEKWSKTRTIEEVAL